MNIHGRCWKVLLVAAVGIAATSTAIGADNEAAYTQAIRERAAKIVAQLVLDDPEQLARVTDLVAGQYRNLRSIHDARDAKIADARRPAADRAVAEAWIGVVRKQASLELFVLHRQFVAQLASELSPEQVDQVKDGMTYGVVPLTYDRYLELLPSLTDEQRATILAHLLEARECAMDAGSADEKHAIFGKYKGRVNNFLSQAGYDMKQAEKDWATRRNAASTESQ